ncbi:MAG: glycosyltransferase family 87 protein [Propionicimonas sp.]|uniref:glycosyltransferase family 87 protein n=1 Tax=Propionicimonas sp. TaxID=1955623 RepID=UPI003D1438C9
MTNTPGHHWLDEERLRVYPRILVVMSGLAAIVYLATVRDGLDFRGAPLGTDFVTFYAASKLALAGRAADVFDYQLLADAQRTVFPTYDGGPFAWFYPPTFLLVVAPLALLPYVPALVAFVGASFAGWLAALRRAIARPGAGWLIASFPGLWVCVAHGQNGLLTAALAGGSLLLLPRRPMLSGVLLGLLIIKPHLAVLFAVALLAARAWRTMLVAVATAVVALGASVVAFGRDTLNAWLGTLQIARVAIEQGYLPWSKMPSTFAALRLLGTPVAGAYVGHAAVALAAAVAVWLVWRRTDDLALRGTVLMAGTFLVNPYAFDYDLVWLAFPIAWMALYGLANGWRKGDREVLVLAWLLPALGTAIAAATHVQLAPIALAALVWIAVRRVWTPRRAATVEVGGGGPS